MDDQVQPSVESTDSETLDNSEELSAKDFVLDRLAQEITAFTGKKSGAKTLAKRLLSVMTESMFTAVAQEGYFRFGGGFGALKRKAIKATTRRVPATGALVDCPARNKVVYVEGKTTKALANNS